MKILGVASSGEVLSSSSIPYQPDHPRDGWSEQDPTDWRSALIDGLEEIKESKEVSWPPLAIGVAGQMHGLVLLDKNGRPIGKSILWNDQRTTHECELIESLTNGRITDWTLNPPRTAFTATKILWVKKNLPEQWKQTRAILLPKDYVRFQLTGTLATDVTDASGTNLLDVRNRKWSLDTLNALGIPAEFLPTLYESPDVVGTTEGEVARRVGLPETVPVIAGAADQSASALGMGVVSNGNMSITLGTSGVVYSQIAEAIKEPTGALHTFCHSVPGTYQMMGGVLSAGGSVSWMHRLANAFASLSGGTEFDIDDLFKRADSSPSGSRGLVFLPYLQGERSPHNNPFARASWFGLTTRHTYEDLLRAVVEGVCFAIKDLVSILNHRGVKTSTIRVGGGGANSSFWLRTLASVLGTEVVPVSTTDATAFGAAMLAGSEAWDMSLQDLAQQWVKDLHTVKPVLSETELYGKLHPVFQQLYERTSDQMAELSNIARSAEQRRGQDA